MTITTRTTELEAVNTILSTIGEAPLSTLTGSLPVDGTTAKNILNEISREVQSAGWHFNTQYKVDLTRDTTNKVPIGTDVVRVQLNNKYDKSSYDVVQRGTVPTSVRVTNRKHLQKLRRCCIVQSSVKALPV